MPRFGGAFLIMKKNNESVIYQGKVVPKNGFRAWVYGPVDDSGNHKKMLAEGWEHYQALVGSGLWFSDIKEVPKTKKSSKSKGE